MLRPTLLLELLQLKLVMELFARGGEAVEVHVPARCVTVAHTLTLTHSQAHNGLEAADLLSRQQFGQKRHQLIGAVLGAPWA